MRTWPADPARNLPASNDTYHAMFGKCVRVRGGEGVRTPVTPLRTEDPFYKRSKDYPYAEVYGQAGMSLAFDKHDQEMVFGAPGTHDWSGTVVVTDSEGENPVVIQPWNETEPFK